jgi:transposase
VSNGKRTAGRPSKYPPEFRHDAALMVLDEDRSIADVARSVGVNEGTLGNWVAAERKKREQARDGLDIDERAELAVLRAEVKNLRMERDLLKRSVAFWVKETVRHEALVDRAVVKGHRLRLVAASR